jgi:threonine dehydratase
MTALASIAPAPAAAAAAALALPTYDDVADAARRIAGHAHRTPVMTSRRLDAELGASLFFKCENLQRAGAFKFRGAYNALSRLDAAARARGVVAYSSGNHAQAVAYAAALLGIPATLLMPEDAAPPKLAATRGYGGRVVTYDRYRDDRDALMRRYAEAEGLTPVPPFDHPHVIAGQGTAAKELIDEVGELDALFACLGGGGLLAGSALAARALSPRCLVFGAEPEAGDDGRQSLRAGRRITIPVPRTLADGAQTQCVGELTFPIIQREVADIVAVPDAALVDAMRDFASTLKLVVEPTGCLSLAAARIARDRLRGARVGVIVTGGNVDLARFASLVG